MRLRDTLRQYMPDGSVWNLAGPANADKRQGLMLAITGTKLPKSKCGCHALHAAVIAAGAPIVDGCIAAQEQSLAEWIQGVQS